MEEVLFPHSRPRKIQKAMIMQVAGAIRNRESLLLHAPTGVGKCVSGDTLILTEKGLTKISELYKKCTKVNALDDNLKIKPHSCYVLKKKKSRLYEVRTQTGRGIEATSDHKFLTLKKGSLHWEKLANIKEGSFIASARKISLIKSPPQLKLENFLKLDYHKKGGITVETSPSIPSLIHQIKNKFQIGNKKIAEKIKCSTDLIIKAKKTGFAYLRIANKIIELADVNKDTIKIKKVGYKFSQHKINTALNEEFAYFFGLMIGDGYMAKKRHTLILSTIDKQTLSFYHNFGKRAGSKVYKKTGDDCSFCLDNKPLASFMLAIGFHEGRKSHKTYIPSIFFRDKNLLKEVIKGVYDSDGTSSGGIIELTTKSRDLKDTVSAALLGFGIYPILKERKIKGAVYYRLFISNSKEKKKFASKIGFRLKRKQKELLANIKEFNPNPDIIPEIRSLIQKSRNELKAPYSRENDFRIYESYAYGFRKPSRERLLKLLESFKSKGSQPKKATKMLEMLCESDIFWDKVISIRYKKKDYVYDATVPAAGNFVGNGIILHNTAASIPVALALSLKDNSTVFFLTSKHTQHKIAIDTLREVRKRHNAKFNAVDFIGKKWMCSLPGVQLLSASEFSDYCKEFREKDNCEFYLNLKHKKRVSPKAIHLLEELKREGPLHVEDFTKKCSESKICPYEMASLLAKESKVVIADYYHMLHPSIRANLLKRIEKGLEDCILIFDEGHSLPGRTRELMSASISNITLDLAAREAKELNYENVVNDLEAMKKLLQKLARNKTTIETSEGLVKKGEFLEDMEKIGAYEEIQGNFKFVGEQILETKKRSYSNSVAHFMESWPGPDEGFVRIVTKGFAKNGKPLLALSYKCLDPSLVMKPLIEGCRSFIAMSGTLAPTAMYKELFGMKEGTITAEYDNPFPEENRLNIIWPETTTKYALRGSGMYRKMAGKCAEIANTVPGNSAFYFPSYKLRDDVYAYFKDICEKTTFLEERQMNKAEKSLLLENFKAYSRQGAVLFAVVTGNFSEGIDLPGDFLKAVTIVGLPLGKPDLETKELINYYDKKFGKGWNYGYVYPAIIRAMQGAGRCIRSKKDRGVIVFLDERYVWKSYKSCFPPNWNMRIDHRPIGQIREFFKK